MLAILLFVVLLVRLNCERSCPSLTNEFIPHPEYCQGYYVCGEGIPLARKCHDGQIFNKEKRICEKGNCTVKPLPKPSCSNDKPTADVQDCRSFSMCDQILFEMIKWRCPQGTIFNQSLVRCETGNCMQDSVPGFRCPNIKEDIMFMGIPEDCQSFIVCYKEKLPVKMRCPFGSVFDMERFFCDWPENTGRDCEDLFGPPYPTGLTRSHTPGTQPPTQDLKSIMPIVHPISILLLLMPVMVLQFATKVYIAG